MAYPATGFSAPPSEPDGSIVNISGSSGSFTVKENPTKKPKPTLDELVSARSAAAPAAVAAAVPRTAELQNATRTAVSSSSSNLSVPSSRERQRRSDLVRAKRALVEARLAEVSAKRELAEVNLEEVQADLDLSAGSHAGSVGRRLHEVQSDADEDDTISPLPPQGTNYFAGVFTLAREVPPATDRSSDIVSTLSREVHIPDDWLASDYLAEKYSRVSHLPSPGGDADAKRGHLPSPGGDAPMSYLPSPGGSAQPSVGVNNLPSPGGVPNRRSS
jgi:hypothetical protein